MPQQKSISQFFRPKHETASQVELPKEKASLDVVPTTAETRVGQKRQQPDTEAAPAPQPPPALRDATPTSDSQPNPTDTTTQSQPQANGTAGTSSAAPVQPVQGATPVVPLSQTEMEAQARQRLTECQALCAERAKGSKPVHLKELLLDPGWSRALGPLMSQPAFTRLSEFVHSEYSKGTVYPPRERIFHALHACPLDQVRVVIVGQDPYHGPNQAMGLCFSVNRGIRVPQSLINIYKELNQDLACPVPKHGDLSSWSTQGVLMLNTMLTVRGGAAGSHKGKGWEQFTDAAISAVSRECRGVVFLLWGKHAQAKDKLIDTSKHHVLKAAHPSPLAAASGSVFVGCKHFSKTNELLEQQGKPPIRWCIT